MGGASLNKGWKNKDSKKKLACSTESAVEELTTNRDLRKHLNLLSCLYIEQRRGCYAGLCRSLSAIAALPFAVILSVQAQQLTTPRLPCINPPQQSSSLPIPIDNQSLHNAQLFSSNNGYVISNGHLLRTETAGIDWTDITPKAESASMIDEKFISENEGFAFLIHQVAITDDAAPTTMDIYHTTSKGAAWSREATLPKQDALKHFGNHVNISFTDNKHGWVILRQQSSSAFSFGDISSTIDGGATWQLLPSPPIFGEILFTSPSVGYLLGGPSNSELYRTMDSGQSWNLLALYNPEQVPPGDAVHLSLPHFADDSHGFIHFSITSNREQVHISSFSTNDGGNNWLQAKAPTSLGSDTVSLNAIDPRNALAVSIRSNKAVVTSTMNGLEQSAGLPLSVRGDASIKSTVFYDNQHGWIILGDSFCLGHKTACSQVDSLLITGNGGKSYSNITPPASSPSTSESLQPNIPMLAVNRMGWDQQVAPSFAQLDDWA